MRPAWRLAPLAVLALAGCGSVAPLPAASPPAPVPASGTVTAQQACAQMRAGAITLSQALPSTGRFYGIYVPFDSAELAALKSYGSTLVHLSVLLAKTHSDPALVTALGNAGTAYLGLGAGFAADLRAAAKNTDILSIDCGMAGFQELLLRRL